MDNHKSNQFNGKKMNGKTEIKNENWKTIIFIKFD